MAYRTTDYLSASALENADYYKEMFIPYGLHYGSQVVLAHNNTCVGLLTLFRAKESENFSDTKIFYLDNLKEHLSARLYQSKVQSSLSKPSSTEYIEEFNLTRRENGILQLLLKGLTNVTIL